MDKKVKHIDNKQKLNIKKFFLKRKLNTGPLALQARALHVNNSYLKETDTAHLLLPQDASKPTCASVLLSLSALQFLHWKKLLQEINTVLQTEVVDK